MIDPKRIVEVSGFTKLTDQEIAEMVKRDASGAPPLFDGSPISPVIWVDALMPCVPNRQWKWNEACHLYTWPGWLDELHHLAGRIGLKRAWFQDKSGSLPHYDLNPSRRAAVIRLGAVESNRRHVVNSIAMWRHSRVNAARGSMGDFDTTDAVPKSPRS